MEITQAPIIRILGVQVTNRRKRQTYEVSISRSISVIMMTASELEQVARTCNCTCAFCSCSQVAYWDFCGKRGLYGRHHDILAIRGILQPLGRIPIQTDNYLSRR